MGPWHLDLVLRWQAARTPALQTVVALFGAAGQETFYLVLLPFCYWCVDRALGRRLTGLFLLSAWANSGLKTLFARPRPAQASPAVHPSLSEPGYGLPSGHAQNAAAVGGGLAFARPRPLLILAVALYLLAMAASRIVAGVHFPGDVLAGLAGGLALGVVGMALAPRVEAVLAARPPAAQAALWTAGALLLLAVHPLLTPNGGDPDPFTAVAPLATLWGFGLGVLAERRRGAFAVDGPWPTRLLRLLVGLAGLILLRLVLGRLLGHLAPAPLWRGLRYAVLGLWAGWGAPALFVATGLAPRQQAGR